MICPALNVLVNLVCPPPSISNKPSSAVNQQPAGSYSESRDRNAEKSTSERNVAANQSESRERYGDGTPVVSSGVVGDKRISLGVGAGGPGLAAQLEQAYRQAREVVRANNGIKILLQLLGTRMVTHPMAIDPIRALACRVLLGLARDDAIAHILTKLQVSWTSDQCTSFHTLAMTCNVETLSYYNLNNEQLLATTPSVSHIGVYPFPPLALFRNVSPLQN